MAGSSEDIYDHDPETTTYLICFIILTLLTIFGNTVLFIGTVFYKSISVDRISVVFIYSSALADILLAVSSLVYGTSKLYYKINHPSNTNFEKMDMLFYRINGGFFFALVMIDAAIFTMMIFYKFFSLKWPLHALSYRKRNIHFVLSLWSCISIGLSFSKMLVLNVDLESDSTTVETDNTYKALVITYAVFAAAIPFIVLKTSLLGILMILRKSRDVPASSSNEVNDSDTKGTLCLLCISMLGHIPSTGLRTLYLSGWFFGLTTLPLQAFSIALGFDPMLFIRMRHALLAVQVIYMLGRAFSPGVYVLSCSRFRKFFKNLVLCRKQVRNKTIVTNNNIVGSCTILSGKVR